MKKAFSRPTADDTEQRRLFTGFRDAGFDGLQLKAGQYQRYLRQPHGFQDEWGRDAATASALIAGGTLDEPGVDALRELIAFGASVRAERIVFCHSVPRDRVTSGDLQQFATTLSALGRGALDQGTRLSLHHHFNQPVMHRPDFDVFFSEVDDGAVGLTVDTAHLVKSGVHDIAALIRDFRGVIDNIHLKDYAGGEFRVLGEGEIDFGPVFQALRVIGYDGWLCADEESGSDLEAGMQACSRFISTRYS